MDSGNQGSLGGESSRGQAVMEAEGGGVPLLAVTMEQGLHPGATKARKRVLLQTPQKECSPADPLILAP